MMKFTKISLALGLAALAAGPAAFALTPAQSVGATPIWLTGASAPTNAVFKSTLALCAGVNVGGVLNPGVLDAHFYMSGAAPGAVEPGVGSGDWMAYTCTVNTAAGSGGVLEGTKVVVYHTVEGGSFNAYTPHLHLAGETKVNIPGHTTTVNTFMPTQLTRVANLHVAGGGGGCVLTTPAVNNIAVGAAAPNNRIPFYTSCATTAVTFEAMRTVPGTLVPAGGASDTEYAINQANLGLVTPLSAIGTGYETNPTFLGQAFGVAVSWPLYARLQARDGLLPSVTFNGVVTNCVANYAPGVCQPDLPAQAYTALANRSTIGGVTATGLFGGAAPPGNKVTLARRVPTSGTQSASNLRFLAKPCATGRGGLEPARGPNADGAPNNSTATAVVVENSSTGGVKTTLTNATNLGEYAMGVVSMENKVGAADKWAFVKLDGTSPNTLGILPTPAGANVDLFQRNNAMRSHGSYWFWYLLELFFANASVAGTPEGDLLSAVGTTLGNTDLVGLFPVPGSSSPFPKASGFRLNSCAPLVQ